MLVVFLCRLAVVAVTEQYINHKVERDVYIESISRLQPHVSRLNHRLCFYQYSIISINAPCFRNILKIRQFGIIESSILQSQISKKHVVLRQLIVCISSSQRLEPTT